VAYAAWVLGLVGALNRTAVLVTALLLIPVAAIGFRDLRRLPARLSEPSESSAPVWLVAPICACLAITVALALVDCFVPPGAHEWDSLSYHLAAPQDFLRSGRIVELPTDHHSYFPFLTQMLFCVGLMFDGWAAAKLIHLAFGCLACCATYMLGRRLAGPCAGWMAALVFSMAPLVLWEAGIAYIELAQTLYVTLAMHAALIYVRSRRAGDAAACGAAAGLALAVKTLSLLPAAGVVALVAVCGRRAKHVAIVVGLSAALGAPFYLRTWALTGNPVYPFAFSVFGGKYWDAARAEAYAGEHRSFGLHASLPALADDLRAARAAYQAPTLIERVRNVTIAPFALVASPRIFHNYADPTPYTSLGFLWLAFLPIAALPRERPPGLGSLALVAAFWFVVWSASMQYMRYLVPLLPVLASVGAFGITRIGSRYRSVALVAAAAVVVQAVTLWSHAVPRAFEQAARVARPDEARAYLSRQVNVYDAQMWLRDHTRKSDGVVLYEETRGFYLDRPVLWGNSPHSTYIPYQTMSTGADLVRWLRSKRVAHALVNLRYAPQAASVEGQSELRAAVAAGGEAGLMLDWYGTEPDLAEPWRPLLGDALRSGHAVVVPEACSNGAVVLRLTANGGSAQ
jgi:4-amino-4-deoxy-L-arabinose transferase-like glycosyltransferase